MLSVPYHILNMVYKPKVQIDLLIHAVVSNNDKDIEGVDKLFGQMCVVTCKTKKGISWPDERSMNYNCITFSLRQ